MTARFSWNEQNTRGHRPRLQKTAGPNFEHSTNPRSPKHHASFGVGTALPPV